MKFRYILIVFSLVLFCCGLKAQDVGRKSFISGLSYKLIFPKDIGDGAWGNIIDEEIFTSGAQISARKDINSWLTIDVPLRLGRLEVREFANEPSRKDLFLGLDAYAVAGIDPLRFPFGPYAFVGVGGDYQDRIDRDFNFYIPAGFGVNIKLTPNLWLNGELQRRTSLTGNENTHYQLAAGVVFNFDTAEQSLEEEELINMIEKDTDGDGVPDVEDSCPSIAGKAMFRGCPDTDNDGVIDSRDKCPNEAGPIATDGCPINVDNGSPADGVDSDGDGVTDDNDNCPNLAGDPATFGCPNVDTDNDGVVDAMDNCPNRSGLERFGGCPDSDGDGVSDDKDACPNIVGLAKFSGCPDTDGDGITDASDNCPTTAGLAQYNGCPQPAAPAPSVPTVNAPPVSSTVSATLTDAAQKVEFETSRATLRASSYQQLDQIVSIMNQYPSYNLEIAGHTDSIGDSAGNQKLSENRAKSCKDYLVRKGISASRINHVGYGEKQPIADNRYKAGRAQNRRVEFRLLPR